MHQLVQYKGYSIAWMRSRDEPYAVGYQITTDPPTKGGEVVHFWLPGDYATEGEGKAAAIAAGKLRIDRLPRRV